MNGSNKNVKTMAILTIENPRFEGSSDGDNKTNSDRRENLEKDLKLGHFAWFPVKGQYEGKTNKEYIDRELVETNDYVLFEIKTDNIKDKIKFYPDVNFPKGISIFSYVNIPPSEITNYYLFSTD